MRQRFSGRLISAVRGLFISYIYFFCDIEGAVILLLGPPTALKV
jgi:hypothetical protein